MMRKKIVSLCMALALCLSLLPATALAADNDTVYVGGEALTGTASAPVYATTDDSGKVTVQSSYTEQNSWQIKWDGSTLTLDGAKIKGAYSSGSLSTTVGIYAFNSSGDVSLNIALQGVNEIFESSNGIWVYSYSSSTNAGNATLTIEGKGSLEASGSSSGILVQSNGGNAALTIQNADVTAENSIYSGDGVTVQAGSSSSASLSVNGGSLTATGKSEDGAGIRYTFGSSSSGSGVPSLNVSNSAIVKASGDTGGITSNSSPVTPSGTGIVFNNGTGTVYGSVTLQEDLTIGEGESLTLDNGASLNAGGHNVIVDGGTVDDSIKTSLGESVIYKVTKVELDKSSLTLGVGKSETLTATITPDNATNKNVTWSSDNTSVATVNNGVVSAVSEGTATITVTTVDGSFTDTCEVTVTHVHTMTKTAAKSATCTAEGNKEYWTCGTCGKIFSDAEGKKEIELSATVIPATEHTLTKTEAKAPTCTAEGNKEYWTCGTCGKIFSDAEGNTEIALEDTVIPATGHTFRGGWCAVCGARDPNYVPPANPNYRIDVTTTEGGTVDKDPAAAKAGETVTLTPAPEEGYEVGEVIVTDRFGDTVDVTANPDGTYTFTMPSGQVKVEVTFVESQPEPLPFTDVAETDWFHDAVRYVYDNGLMDGVGDGQFAPNATTNRAMVVTILYRLAGEPAVSGDAAFTDVESGLWYSNAVLWAAQNGIVNGISETEFAPSGDLTREQLATVLYRYAESMGYDVSASVDLSGFPDAGDIQSYATQALSWAVAEGLLQGFEDDSLQPGGTATRAQIATILMRFCEGVGA